MPCLRLKDVYVISSFTATYVLHKDINEQQNDKQLNEEWFYEFKKNLFMLRRSFWCRFGPVEPISLFFSSVGDIGDLSDAIESW